MSNIIHHKPDQQFVLTLEDGRKAVVDYRLNNNKMDLVYSKVPSDLQGKGIGKELVIKTFEKLTEEGYTAKAICGYIRAVAMRSEKWREIIEV